MDNLLKHFLIMLSLSLLLLVTLPYCSIGLQILIKLHYWMIGIFNHVLTNSKPAAVIRNLIVLLFIPIGLSAATAFIYWIFKRRPFGFFTNMCWALWIILAAVITLRGH